MPREQIFTYKYEGKLLLLAIDRLLTKLQKTNETIDLDVEEELVKKLLTDKTIDQVYIYRYMGMYKKQDAGETVSILPAVIIKFKDDTWTLADGNNKYVAAFMSGRKTIPALVASRQQWAPFIIKPEYQEKSFDNPIVRDYNGHT